MVMVPHEEGGWVWATSNFFYKWMA